ncbi:hypothetical protein GOZ89_05935 [Agrobacterium vitis]|uniref:Uncharacterized protein n=1 Tax=Agrobacterium vitis TaxID=373 RepID=A0A109D001_AGRVI|nr:hypothetical protein [Agrobacterium vitis]KAA3519388.1 hypothetical protein DXM22_00220 [Agrobacterium vitis]KAA3532404.1 hypothetical protein DXT89_03500 [Agrobacterium vitis]MCE6077601.1 hypothetical protein [Agrobacterium vitis]MCF1450961.1 hypothetical protein [Agrobacterium vitis]MCF1466866.1 hypothetical protein [Agrobacterium vitis]
MTGSGAAELHSRESIAYVRQMLGELRLVAEKEGAQMLCYLIEMAFEEAGDLQRRHKVPRMISNAKRSV